MATVHPFFVYYKDKVQETGNQILVCKSIVFISDCLRHMYNTYNSTVLVHVFRKKLFEYFRDFLPTVSCTTFRMAQQLNIKTTRLLLISTIIKKIVMELRPSTIFMPHNKGIHSGVVAQ